MKKYIFTVLALVAVVTGCKKGFLTEEPHLAQSNVLTLSTFDGLDKATAGAYGPLASGNWYGAHFILDHEMKTMNGKRWGDKFEDYDSGRYTDQYAINYNPNNTSPLWGTAYYVIMAANSVIDKIDNPGETVYEASEQDLKNLKAECLFLRALAHFDLVRVYAHPYNYTSDASHFGVPVVTVPDSEATPPRETAAKTYSSIIEWLTEAESIIDPDYQRGGCKDPKATANLEAIQALLARAYQYTGQWQKAADYATKVINSGKFTMWTPEDLKDAACYRLDVPGKNTEVIFEVYVNTSQSYGGGNENVWGMTSYDCYGDCGAAQDVLDLYDQGDVRSTLYSADASGNALFTLKYFGKGLGTIDANNIIVLRLSEMYLIRAEAALNGAKGDFNATADLKTIADNRGAKPSTSSKEGVYTELAKEFAWEAHLWFDLARTGRDMTRNDISGSVPKTLKAKDYRWAMPIPIREFNVNPSLKDQQNPGYNNNN